MEIWIPAAGILIAFSALWWKITTSLATKDDLQEIRQQIHEGISRIDNDIDDRFLRIGNNIRKFDQTQVQQSQDFRQCSKHKGRHSFMPLNTS